MVVKKVMPKLQALIVVALLASGAAKVNNAYAESPALSGKDVLDQAVSLYEKMQNSEVEVPKELSDTGLDETLLKSIALGYVNLDESEELASSSEVRKQDVINILYKTILNYDSSHAISEEEADGILNDCYDNALLDEENRIGYAFFIKQNIIGTNEETNPNKPLNWDSCKILIDLVYDYFIRDVEVSVNGAEVAVGANIRTVTDVWGAPNRIDKSDFGFDWYVYNTDYSKFCMVGVSGERICAVYTNSDDFEFDGIKSGDDAEVLDRYKDETKFRIYADSEGKTDSFMYLPGTAFYNESEELSASKNEELLDMINSYRVRHGKSVYVLDEDTSNTAWMQAISFMGGVEAEEGTTVKGFDIYSVYRQLIERNDPILTDNSKKDTAIGISAPLSKTDKNTYAALVVNDKEKVKREITYAAGFQAPKKEDSDNKELIFADKAFAEENLQEADTQNENSEPPEIKSLEYDDEGNIVITLAKKASDRYHLQVFDVEAEDYIINSYITTDDTSLTVPSKAFVGGADYKLTFTAIDRDGASIGTPGETLITYGTPIGNALEIIGPVSNVEKPVGIIIDENTFLSENNDNLNPDSLEADAVATEQPDPSEAAAPSAEASPKPSETPVPTATPEPTPIPEDAPEFLKEGYEISDEDCVYIDTDYIPLQWQSDIYHDFSIDMYNSDGELVVNTIIENDNSALIQGVDPGTYYIYVTALSRGTFIEKAQDMIRVTVSLPQPVVNEIILDKDDKYYFVYEDEAMGVLYFYDEEIIEQEENSEKVEKKKIIQKQVKSTKAYRELAKYRSRLEYVTGDPTVNDMASQIGVDIVNEAMKYLGTPYVWGGTTPSGFDCSGLVQYVCAKNGIKVDRVTHEQIKNGTEVKREDLQPGDLVFFKDSSGYVHHVGIYIGDDQFIHSPHTGDVVKISSLNEAYYSGEFCGARRVY